MEKSGIYKIVNKVNGKLYVGSAVNIIKDRWRLHRGDLRRNDHDNIHLQNAWNKYGESNFQFEIIEECEECDLIKREQYWLDETKCYERDKGYNICRIAGNSYGILWGEESRNKIRGKNNHFYGKHHSNETRKKLSESHKGENNHLYGKHHSEETKQKISEMKKGIVSGENNPKAKLTWEQVREIREKYKSGNYTQRELAKDYNVVQTNIGYIVLNKIWKE